jgi:hypothetical protein
MDDGRVAAGGSPISEVRGRGTEEPPGVVGLRPRPLLHGLPERCGSRHSGPHDSPRGRRGRRAGGVLLGLALCGVRYGQDD